MQGEFGLGPFRAFLSALGGDRGFDPDRPSAGSPPSAANTFGKNFLIFRNGLSSRRHHPHLNMLEGLSWHQHYGVLVMASLLQHPPASPPKIGEHETPKTYTFLCVRADGSVSTMETWHCADELEAARRAKDLQADHDSCEAVEVWDDRQWLFSVGNGNEFMARSRPRIDDGGIAA